MGAFCLCKFTQYSAYVLHTIMCYCGCIVYTIYCVYLHKIFCSVDSLWPTVWRRLGLTLALNGITSQGTMIPADLGSRGGQLTEMWFNSPQWLRNRENWPENPIFQPSKETQAEAKIVRELLCTA